MRLGLTQIRKMLFFFLTSGDVHFMDTLVSIRVFIIFVELIGLNSLCSHICEVRVEIGKGITDKVIYIFF